MSPLSDPVKKAMADAVEQMSHLGSEAYEQIRERTTASLRQDLGRLVNAEPDEIAFVENTSSGINLIANSLPLESGNSVLLCDTEFPSNVYPWQNLERYGVKTQIVPSHDGGLRLNEIDRARTKDTRVIAVSAVQFFSGKREDLHFLGSYCADHDLWLIVDAMQAAGIVPLDMKEMRIHALAAGGHKALMGPPGQGFVAIKQDLIEQMTPSYVGPLSFEDWDRWLVYSRTPRSGALRFDLGTSNLAGMVGLQASVRLLLDLGIEEICAWVTQLSDLAIAQLKQNGYKIVTPEATSNHAHIVTFSVGSNPEPYVAALREEGIVLRSHYDASGNGFLRISSHAYNTKEEVLRVGNVLGDVNHELN
jgi:selenocysteine lyase/cysteine desulfurase